MDKGETDLIIITCQLLLQYLINIVIDSATIVWYTTVYGARKAEDWPDMKIKSETRKRIQKSLMRQAGTIVKKYKLARSWVRGNTPFAKAVRTWYDLKISQHSADDMGEPALCLGEPENA